VSKFTERDGESVKRNFETTLKELGTDHLDVLHFHALTSKEDVDKIVAEDGAAKVYRKWKEEGVIKAIGITGHTSGELMMDAIKRIEPDCAMFPINPAHSGNLSGGDFAKVVPFALERGVGVIAMKTTARNGLIGKNGVTAEQLVRYAMNMPVSAAVIGMPSLEVLESCAAIARDLPPLSEKDRASLEDKLAAARTDGSLPYLASGYTDCGMHGTV
jgi:predicted aldo/keto reductase-like oxidoreductase